MASNPRISNGSARRKLKARLRALGLPCAICGRPIDYDLPAGHPMCFEMDEDRPVSRWREFGYSSARACALDWGNLQAVHRRCNQRKGALTTRELLRGEGARSRGRVRPIVSSRAWGVCPPGVPDG